MRTRPLLLVAASTFVLLARVSPAQYSPADIQGAVDASFGPWNPVTTDPRGQVYDDIWSTQSIVTLDGIDAAQLLAPFSPYLGKFPLRATVQGPATLYFSFLGARIAQGMDDGVSTGGTAAVLPKSSFWQEGTFAVSEGTQLVTWSIAGESRPAFLDQIWTEADPRPRITSAGLVDAQKGLAVAYQTTTNKPCDAFEATGLPPGLAIEIGTGLVTGTPTELGSFDTRIKASNAAGAHTQSVLFRVLKPAAASSVELSAALDAPGISWSQQPGTQFVSWTSFFHENWQGVIGETLAWSGALTSLAKDGVDAAVVPLRTLPDESRASNWLGAQLQGPGTFSIWARIVAFPNGRGQPLSTTVRLDPRVDSDGINYYSTLNGVIGPQWEQKTMAIPAGHHLVELLVGYSDSVSGVARDSDALVLFDQASFTPQPQNFTYTKWREIVASYQREPEEDREGDGLGLLVEYALGGSPLFNDAALLPEVSIIDGHLTMTVHKSPSASGLEYTVQANKSLADNGWTTFGTEIMDEDANVLIVRCKKSVEQEPTCMLRLRVRLDDSIGP